MTVALSHPTPDAALVRGTRFWLFCAINIGSQLTIVGVEFPRPTCTKNTTSRPVFQLFASRMVDVSNDLWSCERILGIRHVLSPVAHGKVSSSMLEQNYLALSCFTESSGCGGPKTPCF